MVKPDTRSVRAGWRLKPINPSPSNDYQSSLEIQISDAFAREEVQELIRELVEWLSETAPKEAS